MNRFQGLSEIRLFSIAVILLASGIGRGGSANGLQAQEKASQVHRTYADDQDAADQAYADECGARSLTDCNTGVASPQRRDRERAYRTAINTILQHLTERDLRRNDPRNQNFVYLLGSDSEKADLPDRAIRFYRECVRTLSDPNLTRGDIPYVVEDGNTVSAKSACETATARLGGAFATTQSKTTVTIKTITDMSDREEDTWTFVSVSTEPEPVVDVEHQGQPGERTRPIEAGGRSISAERATEAAVSRDRVGKEKDAVTKAAVKQADAEARAAKKQSDAAAKAAKVAAGAPEKAARKEERDRARAERAARKAEEAKEHEKNN